MLQPLPFPNAQRLYQPIDIEELGKENLAVPYAAIQQWQVAANKPAQIAFTAETPNAVEASSGAERIGNVASSTIFFLHWVCDRLLGRSFLPEETEDAILADVLHPGEEIVRARRAPSPRRTACWGAEPMISTPLFKDWSIYPW